MPVLEDDRIGGAVLETELLHNLELCTDQLIECHKECSRLYPNSNVPFAEFRDTIGAAAAKYLVGLAAKNPPSPADLRKFIAELKYADLYLALACMRGDEQAWWEFDRQHRPFIERWTRHLVRGDTDADEVIDAVYVELFGTRISDGLRQSKFRTYTGRGTLRGWLRTVILHAAVDLHRAPRPEVAIEDLAESDEICNQNLSRSEAEDSMLTEVVRQRYRAATVAALDQALSALDDQETLLLLYYHVEGLKLREIARIVEQPRSPIRRWFQRRTARGSRVHESTVMRWLERIYRKISDRFDAELAKHHGLSPEEIEICKAIATDDPAQTITLTPLTERLHKKKEVNAEHAS